MITNEQRYIKNLKVKAIRKFWFYMECWSWEDFSPTSIIEDIGIKKESPEFKILCIYINKYHDKQKICSDDKKYTEEQILKGAD